MNTKRLKQISALCIATATLFVAGCGGGSGSTATSTTAPVNTNTAAAYFTKIAVNNNWTLSGTETATSNVVGIPGYQNIPVKDFDTYTASINGVVTDVYTQTYNGIVQPSITYTTKLDAAGKLVQSHTDAAGLTVTDTLLPASFATGTTWVMRPATATTSALNAVIAAVGVSRTVAAGTFADCLRIDVSYNVGAVAIAGTTYTASSVVQATYYFSRSAGSVVDQTITRTDTYTTTATNAAAGTIGTVLTEQLQPGYIAL